MPKHINYKLDDIPGDIPDDLLVELETIKFVAKAVCDVFQLDIIKCQQVYFNKPSLYLVKSVIIYICYRNFDLQPRALKIYFNMLGANASNRIINHCLVIQRRMQSAMAIKALSEKVIQKCPTDSIRSQIRQEITNTPVSNPYRNSVADLIRANNRRNRLNNMYAKTNRVDKTIMEEDVEGTA